MSCWKNKLFRFWINYVKVTRNCGLVRSSEWEGAGDTKEHWRVDFEVRVRLVAGDRISLQLTSWTKGRHCYVLCVKSSRTGFGFVWWRRNFVAVKIARSCSDIAVLIYVYSHTAVPLGCDMKTLRCEGRNVFCLVKSLALKTSDVLSYKGEFCWR